MAWSWQAIWPFCCEVRGDSCASSWQSGWDEFPEINCIWYFHTKRIALPALRQTEETVISWLHIGHSYVTQSFLLKGEESPMCILCETVKHILLFCSDFVEIREIRFTAQSLEFISKGIIGKHLLTFWKKSVFLTEYKRADLFQFCLCFPIFLKPVFKKSDYIPVLAYMYIFFVCWQNVYRPDITIRWLGIKHQVTTTTTTSTRPWIPLDSWLLLDPCQSSVYQNSGA